MDEKKIDKELFENTPEATADMFTAPVESNNIFDEDFSPETQSPELAQEAKATVKKKSKGGLIGLLGALLALIVAICCSPLLLVSIGDSYIEKGDYKTAATLYSICLGFNGGDKREAVARSFLAIENDETEAGISSALKNGIAVHITYDLNGGNFTNSSRHDYIELKEEKDFSQFYQATKDYYEFKGWEVSKMVFSPEFDDSLIELSLKAKFEAEVYTIAYTNLFSENTENPESYTYETNTITLKNPSRVGYTFVSWTGTGISGGSTAVVIPQGSSGNKAYIANWSPNQYQVEFQPDVECAIENPLTVTYDDAYAFPEIVKRGYTYCGWSDGNTTYTAGLWTLTDNIVVTPVWELDIYKLTYDMAGGTVAQENPPSYTVLDKTININNPTRFGYTFLGWTYEGQKQPKKQIVIPAGSVGSYDFKANWAGNPHVISLDVAGGTTPSNRLNVVFGSQYSIPTPTKTGYTFK